MKPSSKPKPSHYYVSVSDRVWDPETVVYPETADSGCEIDQKYDEAGAVYVGELTKKQSDILQSTFIKFYKGQYVAGFRGGRKSLDRKRA